MKCQLCGIDLTAVAEKLLGKDPEKHIDFPYLLRIHENAHLRELVLEMHQALKELLSSDECEAGDVSILMEDSPDHPIAKAYKVLEKAEKVIS